MVRNRMDRLFARSLIPWAGEETITATKWSPLVDVSENDEKFTMKADFLRIVVRVTAGSRAGKPVIRVRARMLRTSR